MNLLQLISLSAVIAAPCTWAAMVPELLKVEQPFTPAGVVSIDVQKNIITDEEKSYRVESGVLNGTGYKIWYADGSGAFSSGGAALSTVDRLNDWSVGCERDAITDRRSCYLQRKNLWIFIPASGRAYVSIGQNHYPGSGVAVRVDGGKAVAGGGDGRLSVAASAGMIRSLLAGRSVTMRHMEWPYRSWVDQTYDLTGFPESWQYVNWAVKRIK